MEEAAIATVQFLVRLLFPIALVAIGIGVLTIGFSGLARRRLEHVGERNFLPRSSAVEGAVVGVCAAISFIALVVAVQTVRLNGGGPPPYQPLSVLVVVSAMLLGLPALLWKTRLRWAAEGIACIALAVTAVLCGFSIGFLFVPLLVLMIWICIQHLRETAKERRISRRLSG